MNWISVKDDTPHTFDDFLINTNGREMYVAFWNQKEQRFFWKGDVQDDEVVTHWMVLPEPPP